MTVGSSRICVRVEQDEAHCRPVPPAAPQAVPEAAVAGEEGGAVHGDDFPIVLRPLSLTCCDVNTSVGL